MTPVWVVLSTVLGLFVPQRDYYIYTCCRTDESRRKVFSSLTDKVFAYHTRHIGNPMNRTHFPVTTHCFDVSAQTQCSLLYQVFARAEVWRDMFFTGFAWTVVPQSYGPTPLEVSTFVQYIGKTQNVGSVALHHVGPHSDVELCPQDKLSTYVALTVCPGVAIFRLADMLDGGQECFWFQRFFGASSTCSSSTPMTPQAYRAGVHDSFTSAGEAVPKKKQHFTRKAGACDALGRLVSTSAVQVVGHWSQSTASGGAMSCALLNSYLSQVVPAEACLRNLGHDPQQKFFVERLHIDVSREWVSTYLTDGQLEAAFTHIDSDLWRAGAIDAGLYVVGHTFITIRRVLEAFTKHLQVPTLMQPHRRPQSH